jgi:hypothetical protein
MARGRFGGRPERGPSLYFPAVNAEFNWWLLIVGLVVGAGIAWFVLMDARRRDVDIDEHERPREALWLSRMLGDEGHPVSPDAAERMLELHRMYLEASPPDDPQPVAAEELSTGDLQLADDHRVGVERRAPDVGE